MKNCSTVARILLAFVIHPIGGVFVDADVTHEALAVEAQFGTEEVGTIRPVPLSRMLDVHVLATVGAQFAAQSPAPPKPFELEVARQHDRMIPTEQKRRMPHGLEQEVVRHSVGFLGGSSTAIQASMALASARPSYNRRSRPRNLKLKRNPYKVKADDLGEIDAGQENT